MPHTFLAETTIPLPLEEVFAFFSDARNLERITPKSLRFRILTPPPIVMAEGLRIDYALRLLGIPFRWQSLISVWEPPRRFVDEQTKGPYRSWRHTHAFAAQDDGTLMTDEVEYELPLGPLGWLGLPLVKLQLGRIFRHREKAIQRLLLEAEAG